MCGPRLKTTCSNTMINYHLSQKFKLLEKSESNLTIILIDGMVSIEELALVQKKGIDSSHKEQNSLDSRRHTCTITAAAGVGGLVGLQSFNWEGN